MTKEKKSFFDKINITYLSPPNNDGGKQKGVKVWFCA